jgi:hypothetical protein
VDRAFGAPHPDRFLIDSEAVCCDDHGISDFANASVSRTSRRSCSEG